MIISEVYRSFLFRLNKLGTNSRQNVSYPQFVNLINKAQLHWAEIRFKADELNISRIDELQILLKDYKGSPVKSENFFAVKLPVDYFHYNRSYAKSPDCPKELTVDLVEEGNINEILSDAFRKPSLAWEETVATIFGNELRVYTDDFSINEVNIKYYRLPIKVDIEGYTYEDDSSSKNVDLEFDGVNAEEIIDLAVQLATQDISDTDRYQTVTRHIQEHN